MNKDKHCEKAFDKMAEDQEALQQYQQYQHPNDPCCHCQSTVGSDMHLDNYNLETYTCNTCNRVTGYGRQW